MFKTLVIYSKETGEVKLALTPNVTPDGKELNELSYPGWFDANLYGVIHDKRRTELYEPHPTRTDANGVPVVTVKTLRARVRPLAEGESPATIQTELRGGELMAVELVDNNTPLTDPNDPLS